MEYLTMPKKKNSRQNHCIMPCDLIEPLNSLKTVKVGVSKHFEFLIFFLTMREPN